MKRLISLAVSTLILIIIYTQIDVAGLIAVFRDCNLGWMAISLGMVVPITFFSSWRLQQVVPPQVTLGLWEAHKLILAASVLNMVLPSKMGDIAKAYFMRDRSNISGSLALSIVVFEKACDFLSLLLWCGVGLILFPVKDTFFVSMSIVVTVGFFSGVLILGSRSVAKLFFGLLQRIAPKKISGKLRQLETSWQEMQDYIWRDRSQLLIVATTSIFIWLLHLLQIWFFILALNAWVAPITNLALSPLAILAGLLPLTFAGVGTRDAALIFLYQPYLGSAAAAALGLLCTSRYLLPAIGGLPFLNQYLSRLNQSRSQSHS
ncbi:MAG: putative integral membrane protein [Phormidesmis priestleyi Ana]|uniref:Putative integral membrane protein n=1 Tax=Phormidesmis priestleyi Ana TaxID=1666911 RepID=A0A0P7ZR90_9CYAN|nr:MAG: putative integral membrane protein [Phormidesmis priestleyi Ana]